MTNSFEVFPGGVSVRDKAGTFKPVKTPDGVSDLAFRNAIATAYTFWNANGKLPSVKDLHKLHPAIPTGTYSAIVLTDEFQDALRYRGVEWNPEAGLSLEQQSVLLKLQDYTDRRTISAKLRELGVPMARYQAWLKHPLFREMTNKGAENVLSEAVAPTLQALAANATAGDNVAGKLLLEISGRWNPNQQSLEDARVVVMAMVEAVVKHVHDPQVRAAIMADVRLKADTLQALES